MSIRGIVIVSDQNIDENMDREYKTYKDKYELFYQYSRLAYETEYDRYRKLDDKASKYLSFISIFIVAFTFLLRFSGEALFPPVDKLAWLACMTFAFTFILFLVVFSYIYRALKIRGLPGLPCGKNIYQVGENENITTTYHRLTERLNVDTKEISTINTQKAQYLVKALNYSAWAIAMFTLSLILIIFYHF